MRMARVQGIICPFMNGDDCFDNCALYMFSPRHDGEQSVIKHACAFAKDDTYYWYPANTIDKADDADES